MGVLLLPGFVYGTLGPTSGAPCPENPTFVCQVASDTTHDVARVLYVVGLLLGLVYQIVLDARGGTIGKHLFDVEVVDAETGEPLGVRRAGTRAAARLVSFLPLGAGCFAMLRDPERRTWHDRMTDTAVVRLEGDTERSGAGPMEDEPEAASDGPLLP